MQAKMIQFKDIQVGICPLCAFPLFEEARLNPFTGNTLVIKYSCSFPSCSYFTFVWIDLTPTKNNTLIEDSETLGRVLK